jgi:hypothetical protein
VTEESLKRSALMKIWEQFFIEPDRRHMFARHANGGRHFGHLLLLEAHGILGAFVQAAKANTYRIQDPQYCAAEMELASQSARSYAESFKSLLTRLLMQELYHIPLSVVVMSSAAP